MCTQQALSTCWLAEVGAKAGTSCKAVGKQTVEKQTLYNLSERQQTNKQTNGQTNKQTNKQTDGQTNKQTNKQIDELDWTTATSCWHHV